VAIINNIISIPTARYYADKGFGLIRIKKYARLMGKTGIPNNNNGHVFVSSSSRGGFRGAKEPHFYPPPFGLHLVL
jgi:hypothetical protein